MTFEQILDENSVPVRRLVDATKKQAKAVNGLLNALLRGEMKIVEKLRQNLLESLANSNEAANAIAPIDFDASEYLKPGGEFFSELLQAAETAGLTIFERDGTVFCFPVLLRTDPSELQVRIDKSKVSALRPATIVKQLKAFQQKEVKSKPESFLALLAKAYPYVVSLAGLPEGSDVKLSAIYGLFTIMPEIKSSYSLLDFSRDLYFLDVSGIVQTRNMLMSLSASTATRESKDVLRFVDRDGREKVYSSVRFVKMTA